MKVSRAILLLLAIWGAIYLSWLGSQELRGEEARRIVPAQEMLRTGDWIVPRIAGEVYSNKPPLINWLIAASFHLTGSTTEFTARLPSVICLLLLAVVMLVGLRKQLGVERALIVALVFLTPLAMIDKGRLAEIEALYVALFGIAAITWICWWSDQRSPWLYWTVPYLFIGLGLLAKGPPHLLFWVILVTSILLFAKRLKDILHPAHLIGLFLMTSLFLPWVLANIAAVGEA
ncbi:MAG: glycosyltransferase family 39 protein, partial [Verrucomicrobiota bacterium]